MNSAPGIAVERPKSLPHGRAGTEDITVDDTFEGDYGRLLEAAAMRTGWRALQDSSTGSASAASREVS